jgi:ankyrin repeat protein
LVLLPDMCGNSCLSELLRAPCNHLHKNYLGVMQALLDVGGRDLVMMTNSYGNNCLHKAVKLRNLETVNLLLRYGGGDLTENKNTHGISPLKRALEQQRQYGNTEIVDTLLCDITGR